ncbi:hemerythrin domain-containing protein [Phytoactinopolyspora halotolerans]|uniref:Hemerythrin domain-containing protein n=1 Tax=Phytoactinopolyspora halotolerans TaxID=1981512 RepID=A0A6L9S9U7_9ACTN|nr:hemerythrin domain-containing protein [Phytoactinopolyspora halotolerans]NEE01461.1 hemerythrin domain-containing protein [Phytoactinopolyspora halotolerans]
MPKKLDVVELITQDHREVERLFELMKEHPEQRPLLLPVMTSLLMAHSRAEEMHVYPAAQQEAGENDEIAHSQEEHQEAEQMLERLQHVDPMSSDFDRLLSELVNAVNEHVQEEENTVLPGMRERLSDERRDELADAFVAARTEHLGARPGEATKEELARQAQNAGVSGTSSMNKSEISDRLRGD